jgi:ribosome-binding factor A
MKKNAISYRAQKVAHIINVAIVECLMRGKKLDERLVNCPITITKVLINNDLRIVNCYFLPFNTDLNYHQLSEALNNSKYAIREWVTREVKLKYSPEIRFHYDHSIEHVKMVETLLEKALKANS